MLAPPQFMLRSFLLGSDVGWAKRPVSVGEPVLPHRGVHLRSRDPSLHVLLNHNLEPYVIVICRSASLPLGRRF